MQKRVLRAGLIGAGYIAQWHADSLARLSGVRLAAVCDSNLGAARARAAAYGAQAFGSLEDMLARETLDAVHILTPPHLHAPQAIAALEAGLHVLSEKPFAVSEAEAEAMQLAAEQSGKLLAVNHNFLGLPAYQRLKALIAEGKIGRIDRLQLHWHYPLSPLRAGPFGLWMLQSPSNLFQELAPHLFAFVEDLLGPIGEVSLRLARPIALPGGRSLPQAFTVLAQAGGAEVYLSISLVEGGDDRAITLRGVTGTARLDLAADTLVLTRANSADLILNPLLSQLGLAGQHLGEGLRNATRQLVSLNRNQPYALGFSGILREFYGAISEERALAPQYSAQAAAGVTRSIAQVLALMPAADGHAPEVGTKVPNAGAIDAVVIGGTGFIGRALTRALVASGRRVRVLSRGNSNPFADLGPAVEIAAVGLSDEAALQEAMNGVPSVYHLARAEEDSWDAYLEKDVAVTERIARAAVAAKVQRFIYTGTIASYDASDPQQEITEDTSFGPMEARNLYARSKALCEARLLALHQAEGLPLVILRPGIVLGEGGPLQHWGIGRWHGAGAVRIWGNGRNILPFVLVEDVAQALLQAGRFHDRLSRQGLEGESFNLIGEKLMSARDYFAAIHRLTGAKIRVASGQLSLLYLGAQAKYRLKCHVLRKPGLIAPSKADWLSRGHLSGFSNAKARRMLDWQPEADAERFAARAIQHQSLFGF